MTGLTVGNRRVVVERGRRSGDLLLLNQGPGSRSYRVQVTYRAMTATGDLIHRSEPGPGELPWSDVLTFAPRQVTLGPGESQTVRFAFKRGTKLPDGEYLYGISIFEVKVAEPSGPAGPAEAKEVQMKLNMNVGLNLALVMRQGRLQAKGGLGGLALESPKAGALGPTLSFRLSRTGTCSIAGTLDATFRSAEGSAPEPVGRLQGVAVYANLDQRVMSLPLARPGGKPLAHGVLTLAFTPDEATTPDAEAHLDLP